VRLETWQPAHAITFNSRRRKLQRFLLLKQLTFEHIWFPIPAWLKADFGPNQVLHIAIDRTSWGCINLLMVSWIEDKRAILSIASYSQNWAVVTSKNKKIISRCEGL